MGEINGDDEVLPEDAEDFSSGHDRPSSDTDLLISFSRSFALEGN